MNKPRRIRACGIIEVNWTWPEGITIEQAVENAQAALEAHFGKHGLRFDASIGLDNARDRDTDEELL